MLQQSILYNFVIIGEASASIPGEIKNQYPAIPWRTMTGMRNIMAHEYFQVSLAVVWQTIRRNLPELMDQLKEIQVSQQKINMKQGE